MSMFLAPIHFMVYGKNQLQEQLIARIAERAAAEGWATAEALDAYCSHEDRPLDAIIDVSNIHGWLSNSIALDFRQVVAVHICRLVPAERLGRALT